MPFGIRPTVVGLIVPALVLSLGLSGAAYGERGGNGNGNGQGNGNGNQNSQRANAARGNAAAQAPADSSMPARLQAYKSSYLAAASAASTAARYKAQIDIVSAMTEAQFLASYPGADYQATLTHLRGQYQANLDLAAVASQRVAADLAAVTEGKTLTAEGLAELNQMLGL